MQFRKIAANSSKTFKMRVKRNFFKNEEWSLEISWAYEKERYAIILINREISAVRGFIEKITRSCAKMRHISFGENNYSVDIFDLLTWIGSKWDIPSFEWNKWFFCRWGLNEWNNLSMSKNIGSKYFFRLINMI